MGKLKKVLLLVLALCMMISIMSIAATAGDTPVAQIGEETYTSLADAIAAAQDDDTVTLLADVTLSDTLEIEKSITLDLNENTLSKSLASVSDKTPVIKALAGTVEIKNGEITYDISAYTSTGAQSNANVINVGMNMSNGIYSGGECDLTLNGVDVSVTFPKGKSLSMIYVESGKLNVINSNLSATNVSGNTSAQHLIYTTAHASAKVNPYVSISGSTTLDTNSSAGIHAIWLQGSNDTLIISGNDVTISADAMWKTASWSSTYSYAYAVNNQSGAACTIEGGKFLGKVWQTKGTIDVSGGYFGYAQGTSGQKNKITLAEGYEYLENTDSATMDDYPYVVAVPASYVAQIGAAKYETLADAIAAVPTDGTATTITMIDDSVEAGTITIASTKNIVLDLNGHKVSHTSTLKSVYFITNNGTLEITDSSVGENGKITMAAVPDTGYSVENVTLYNCGGTLTLTKGTIENTTNGGLTYAVNNSSNAWGSSVISTFNMTGGVLSAPNGDATLRVYQNTGVSWKVYSTNHVNISGGTILDNAIFVDTVLYTDGQDVTDFNNNDITKGCVIDTKINITGGTINGLIDMKIRHPFGTSLNISGGDFTNAKLWVRKYANEYGKNLSAGTLSEPITPMVNISGGTWSFVTGKAFGLSYDCGATSWTSYEKPYYVTGGTYSVDPTDYVASGYEATNNGNGTWTVGAIKPFAAYNANGDLVGRYLEVDDAITAAGNGGTIKLVADVNKQVSIYERTISPLTFDLNGHWIRVDQGAGINLGATWTFMDQYTTYTFTDTVGNGGIEITPKYFGNACISDNNGRTIIIEGGTYISTGKAIYCTGSDATLTINGGTFTGDIYVHDTGYGHGEVAITGGTVNGTISAIDNAVLTVSGGTFNSDPTAYVAPGYEAVNNGTWTVDKIKVAQIGEVKYETLADAIAAATDGDTIELLADVSLTERLFINAGSTPAYAGSGNRYATTTENKSITLNLNGHNITSSSNIALAGGSLNITGAGTIATTASGLAPIEIRGTGNLTSKRTLTIGANVVLNGGEYGLNVFGSNDSNKNVIDVTVNGRVNGTLFVLGNLTNAGNEINIVVNGTIAAPANTNDAIVGIALNGNANVTVNTGAIVSGESGIEVRRGTLVVNGGTITATATEYSSTANNSGSTTKGAAIAICQYNTGLNATINGGTLNGVKKIAVNGDMSGVNVQTYTTDNTVIPAGYKWAATSGNMYTLTEVTYVAQIGEVKYETLADAIAAAQSGNTITLLEDIDLTATVNIEKSLTIALNGKNITATNARALWVKSGEVAITGTGTISATKTANGSFASSSSVIRVGDSGTAKAKLTIGTGVTVSTDYCYGVTVFGTNTNGVELVVDGQVTVTGTAAAISGNGNSGNKGNVTINAGAYVTATADAAIYHPQGDTLTINGGSITGPVAVYQKSGTLNITGGTIYATGEAAEYSYNGNGANATGDAIVIDNCGYPGGAPSAYISGATITSEHGKQIGYYVNGNNEEGTVLAGSAYTLNTNKEKEWVADTSVTGYSYRIATPTYVAQIGETKYTSLADAIAAANADTTSNSITITLLEDIDFSTGEYADYKWAGSTYNPLTIKRSNVTIDLDGHTISEMGNAALVFGNLLAKDGRIENITIKNGTLRAGKTDNVTNSYVLGIAGVDGVLVKNVTTMGGINVYTGSKNVVIESCNVAGTKYYTVCAQCGSDVTIKGTTYTKNTDNTVANKSMFWIQGAGTDSDMVTTENPTGEFDTSSITIESGNFTVDTSNEGVFYLISGVKPIVKGGYFNIDPTACVAEGCSVEAGTYVIGDVTYNFKVVQYVEQSTTNTTTTTTDEQSGTTTTTTTDLATKTEGETTQYVIRVETTTTVGSADPATTTTYTPVNVDVTSNNNKGADLEQNIDTTGIKNAEEKETAIATAKQTVEAVTDQTAEFKAKLDKNEASSANVLKTTAAANAIAKAAAAVNAGQITDAKIELKTTLKSYTLADGTNSSVKATKVVYEIKPVAVLYNGTSPLGNAVELDNADIKEGESFTITIPVPANMTASTVKVSHIGTNGYSTEIGTYEVQGEGNNRYVTVTVDHFSEFELEEAAVDIDGNCVITASISLKDSIDINFYVKNIAVGTSLSDYEVRYTFNGVETVVPGNEWIPANSGSYKFVVASCAAKQINDNVEFEVLYKGVRIKEVDSYSIRQYCVNKINANSDQKLVEICRAVLDYGAAAQNYFNYNTENLANDGGYGLTSKEESVPNTYNIVSATKASDVTKLSATLSTVSKTEINFYVTTDYMQTVKVTLNDNDVSNIEYGLVEGSNNVYKITVKGIAARNLDNVYVLTVETEAETTTTLTYSALAYAYRKQDSSLSESGLSLAIYNYYLKAKAYFG